MTVNDSKALILNYLLEHDFVTFDDLGKFFKTSENTEIGISSCLLALTSLVNDGVLGIAPLGNALDPKSLHWILISPLHERFQNVKLNGALCARISGIVKDFSETVDAQIDTNPLNLQESDIEVLIDLLSMMSDSQNEDEEKNNNSTKPDKEKQK